MRVEVIPAGGLGGRQPLVTQAHQVVVFGDLGTPIAVVYDDGADLLWQLAEFLRVVGANREAYTEATEPSPE